MTVLALRHLLYVSHLVTYVHNMHIGKWEKGTRAALVLQ